MAISSKTNTTEPFFEKGKWYILRKPRSMTAVCLKGISYNWVRDMNQYDNTIVYCKNIRNGVAWFDQTCDYAFVQQWCEGPYDSKAAAEASQRPNYQNNRSGLYSEKYKTKYKSYYDEDHMSKSNMDQLTNKETLNSIRHLDPSQRSKDGIKAKIDKIVGRWTTPTYSIKKSGKSTILRKGKKNMKQKFGDSISSQSVNIEDDTTSIFVKVDPIDAKYDAAIDKIFNDFHAKREREKKLKERMEYEFAKGKTQPRMKIRWTLLGVSIVAVIASGHYFLTLF